MNPFTAFVKRHPQLVFWAIAYITGTTGYILSRLYPSDLWIFFVWGSFLGGALVTAIADGRAGLKTYFGRMVRWRAGIQWYLIALLTPILLPLLAAGANLISGAQITAGFAIPDPGSMLFFYLLAFFTIALGEEPGFRGFSLPRFLNGRSAYTAALIVGVLHAIWHLPLVFGGDEPVFILLNVLGSSVLFTWVFIHTNGSVLIAMLLHASSDLAGALFGEMFAGADAAAFSVWLAVMFLGMALLLRLLAGRELGRRPAPAEAAPLPGEQPLAVE